jgi:Pycsar effector protein
VPESTTEPSDALADVVGRRSVDYVLRNTQQQIVALTGQADLKASIVITASSLVLSISATQWDRKFLRPGLFFLAVGMLGALCSAIVAVMPKFRLKRESLTHWPESSNTLFFGDYTRVTPDVWVEHMGEVLASDARIYEAILRDLHAQGDYLIRMKYRLLRLGYLLFVAAFVMTALAQLIAWAF